MARTKKLVTADVVDGGTVIEMFGTQAIVPEVTIEKEVTAEVPEVITVTGNEVTEQLIVIRFGGYFPRGMRDSRHGNQEHTQAEAEAGPSTPAVHRRV